MMCSLCEIQKSGTKPSTKSSTKSSSKSSKEASDSKTGDKSISGPLVELLVGIKEEGNEEVSQSEAMLSQSSHSATQSAAAPEPTGIGAQTDHTYLRAHTNKHVFE